MMHGPVKQSTHAPERAASGRPEAQQDPPNPVRRGSEARISRERPADTDDQDQIRDALHMVLNVNVYDCAGRAVTVKDMLRGSLATMVRVALDRKRGG